MNTARHTSIEFTSFFILLSGFCLVTFFVVPDCRSQQVFPFFDPPSPIIELALMELWSLPIFSMLQIWVFSRKAHSYRCSEGCSTSRCWTSASAVISSRKRNRALTSIEERICWRHPHKRLCLLLARWHFQIRFSDWADGAEHLGGFKERRRKRERGWWDLIQQVGWSKVAR